MATEKRSKSGSSCRPSLQLGGERCKQKRLVCQIRSFSYGLLPSPAHRCDVRSHRGPGAHPSSTPMAMTRLVKAGSILTWCSRTRDVTCDHTEPGTGEAVTWGQRALKPPHARIEDCVRHAGLACATACLGSAQGDVKPRCPRRLRAPASGLGQCGAP
jgi:hypothetical protein